MLLRKRGLTFDKAVEKYLEHKLEELTNEKHRKQWRSTLTTHASPAIGKMLVSEITVHDIQRLLEPIWMTTTETAKRVRSRVENVLDWAQVKGHRTGENPARWKGNLDALMPKPGKVAKSENHPAVALKDAQRWFAALQSRDGVFRPRASVSCDDGGAVW